MAKAPTRVLCPRCYQSFTPELGAGELCPACSEQESARATRAVDEPRVGAVTGIDEGSRAESDEGSRAESTATVEISAVPATAVAAPATLTEAIVQFFPRQIREAREWCEGRVPWVRLPLWLYLVWTFGRHLGSDEPYRSMFDGINLGIHELGHAIFRPLGMYMMAAGGTITQLAAPIASLFVFRRQKDFFGMSVCLCWIATNLWGISVYMADARALKLPLVAPGMGLMPSGDGGGGIIHDWNYLLGSPGLLKYDTIIAGAVAVAGVVIMLAGLAFGAWLLVRMLLSKQGPRIHFDEF